MEKPAPPSDALNVTDQTLMKKVQSGDKIAFDCCMKDISWLYVVTCFAFYIVEPVADVAQDVFLRVWTCSPMERQRPFKLALRIATNQAFRRAAHSQPSSEQPLSDGFSADEETNLSLPDWC
jgi:hypothetical protein